MINDALEDNFFVQYLHYQDSEERRSEGGSLSPGEPLHHTTPRMASIDAETIRRHMAGESLGLRK